MTFREEISNEEIKQLPRKVFNGDIFLIDTERKFEIAIPLLQEYTTLGFDTETKPSFKKGKMNSTALLQLATEDKAFLFRLNKIGFPDHLADILANENILKIGVAIRDDLNELKRLKDFEPGGFVDLQDTAKDLNIKNISLKKMAAIVLNFRISKSQRVSNWEQEILSPAQLKYAATDAWVCYELYQKIKENHNFLNGRD
jgi:ribonuclease D